MPLAKHSTLHAEYSINCIFHGSGPYLRLGCVKETGRPSAKGNQGMRTNAHHWAASTFFAIGLSLALPITASETAWSCWYQDTNIHCVPAFTPSPEEIESPYQRALNDSRHVDFQDNGKWIVIPLHTEPRNWSRVQMLVESVMCDGRPGCTIELNQTPLKAALLDR